MDEIIVKLQGGETYALRVERDRFAGMFQGAMQDNAAMTFRWPNEEGTKSELALNPHQILCWMANPAEGETL